MEKSVQQLLLSGEQDDTPSPEVIPVEITGEQVNANGETEYSWRELTTDPNDTGGRSSTAPDGNGPDDDFAFPAMDPAEGESFILRHWIASTEDLDDGTGNGTTVSLPTRMERRTLITGAAVGTFFARIEHPEEGSLLELSPAQWSYPFVEVEYDPALTPPAWTVLANGRTGSAVNTLEAANTGTLGYGIAISGGPPYYVHNTNNKYEFLPVPSGVVVQVRTAPTVGGGTTYAFSAPNPIDGQC